MNFEKMITKKILEKDEEQHFYKNKYEQYKKSYYNLINKNNEKNKKLILKYNEISSKMDEIIEKTENIDNNIPLLKKSTENLDNLNSIFKVAEIISLMNNIKLNNSKILEENKYLKNKISSLKKQITTQNKISDEKNKNFIIQLYEDETLFYKNEYFKLMEKQEEYENFIMKLLDDNLRLINHKHEIYDKIMRKHRLRQTNIAYVLSGFPTLSETFVLNELRWLVENNYNVKVFCYNNPQNPVTLDFDLEVIRFDKEGDPSKNLEKLLIENNIDLIHSHFVYPTGTLYTYPLAKKLKIPFTLFAHAFDIFVKTNDNRNKLLEISKSEYCKGIFTLSNYHKNYLMDRNVSENKIIITRQATEYQIYPLKQKNNEIKKIITISRFVEKKGIDILIEAAKILENEEYEFSIYGFGDLQKEYEKQINNLKLTNIKIKGSLKNPQEVKKVFDESDLFVSACRIAKNGDRDGIPTVMFESMAYGVPVLTTNVSAIPEVIVDNKNGFLVKQNNPYELAMKIKEISSKSPEKLYEIRKNAQKDVQNISSIESTMQKVLNTWENI